MNRIYDTSNAHVWSENDTSWTWEEKTYMVPAKEKLERKEEEPKEPKVETISGTEL